MRRLEARYIAIKQIRDIKEQIEELKKERVWAEVIENEKVKYMYDVKTKQQHLLLFVPYKYAHVSCPVDRALEFCMPRFQNRTFQRIDNFAYLRHAKLCMVEGHYILYPAKPPYHN